MKTVVRLCHSLGLVAALGCAPVSSTSTSESPEPSKDSSSSSDAGLINGIVKNSSTGEAIANALIILQCSCLDVSMERTTTERGIYSFGELPPGNYTIQVFAGESRAYKMTELAKGKEFRADFAIDSGS